jgi:hypothetical protein
MLPAHPIKRTIASWLVDIRSSPIGTKVAVCVRTEENVLRVKEVTSRCGDISTDTTIKNHICVHVLGSNKAEFGHLARARETLNVL